jgi:hypothetical protein
VVGKTYLSVDMARMRGDPDALRALGRLGGQRSAKKRKAKAASDKRIEALVAGTIVGKPRRRPTITVKRLLALQDWVKNPANYAEECWLRDEEANLHLCPID